MSDVDNAVEALDQQTAAVDRVFATLQADREDTHRATRITRIALIIAMVLFFIDAGALVGVVIITTKIRSVQVEGVARSKATKANTDEVKRLAQDVLNVANDTHRTSTQLDCAFEVATTHPGLGQTDPQENLRLVTECVTTRLMTPTTTPGA